MATNIVFGSQSITLPRDGDYTVSMESLSTQSKFFTNLPVFFFLIWQYY